MGLLSQVRWPRELKKHWRYLVARYGAYPIIWCLAGETTMPAYDSTRKEEERKELRAAWAKVGTYLREIDPYHHPITAHHNSFREVDPRSMVDVDMLQCGHGYASMERAPRFVTDHVRLKPRKPVLIGEVCYEGEYGANWQDMQRYHFWTSITNGSTGHTYGAHAIWQFITRSEDFVGMRVYGIGTWEDAMKHPGSGQLGMSKRLLERYPWWEFEPRRERRWDDSKRISPFATGIPGKVWMIYLSSEAIDGRFWGLAGKSINIERGAQFRAYFFNPMTGQETDVGQVQPDSHGRWAIPRKIENHDMILVLEAPGIRRT